MKCIKYGVSKQHALEEIAVLDFVFESYYLVLNIKKDDSLGLEVQKLLAEFNIC